MAADERTPLLPPNDDGNGVPAEPQKPASASRLWRPANRVLLAGFLITLSFSFTQVPLLYVFREMECDIFYSKNPPFEGPGDRCSRNEIAAKTAQQFALLGMSTTFCGTWNLFVSGQQVKQWGPRAALLLQIVIPAFRVLTQILGVIAGGQAGIWIIQCTQLITILGGPAGYILVINTIASELVAPAERTAVFGQLQGSFMLGQAIGFLVGGVIGDQFGVQSPFIVAFCFFLLSAVFARFTIPFISKESLQDPKKASRGLSAFFAPLKVLWPQNLRLESGRLAKHPGIFFLCCGVFLGVLATGYAPTLMQMYATTVFDFDQAGNGWLMSGNALMRAFFLIFLFPSIISAGRKWYSKRNLPRNKEDDEATLIPTEPQDFDAPTGTQGEDEPLITKTTHDSAAYEFDLFFLRWSLLVDGLLTASAALATQGWHVYLVAFLLPFGSGTAPAAKGVITEMCPSSQRVDALNAITLVENIARLSTLGLFGFIFSALAEIGQVHLTFFVNGGIAILGMLVLLLSHFPPRGSALVEEHAEESQVNGQDDASQQS